MPNRIIKESICTSDSIDGLSWFEECFFYRLIVSCDDYGRMDARPPILRARLFPLKTVTDKQVEVALQSLRTAAMLDLYTVDGRTYLQLRTWGEHQRIRNVKEKYPAPDFSNSPQLAADCRNSPLAHAPNPIQSESNPNPNPESNPKDSAEPEAVSTPPPKDIFDGYEFSPELRSRVEEWLSYKREKKQPYKQTGLKSLLSQIKSNVSVHGEQAVICLISECMASNWQGIIFDRLEKGKKPKQLYSACAAQDDGKANQRVREDMERMRAIMEKEART